MQRLKNKILLFAVMLLTNSCISKITEFKKGDSSTRKVEDIDKQNLINIEIEDSLNTDIELYSNAINKSDLDSLKRETIFYKNGVIYLDTPSMKIDEIKIKSIKVGDFIDSTGGFIKNDK